MRLRSDARGVVYVEFLLVFMPVFILFLALVQLGFAYGARLVVQHAATRAGRAAVVVIDDDPSHFGGEPRGRLDPFGPAAGRSPLDLFMDGAGFGARGSDGPGSARFRDVRAAASVPLLAMAPATLAANADLVAAIGDGEERILEGARRYNRNALAVTFLSAPGVNDTRSTFGPTDAVTVRVTYVFRCSVPMVSAMMCDTPSRTANKLTSAELSQIAPFSLPGRDGARYLVLRAEATLRNQGAAYRYAGEGP